MVDGAVERIQDRRACPVALLEKHQKEWAEVWGVRPPEVPDAVFPALCASLTAAIDISGHVRREHLLSANKVSKVSRSFKAKTCQPGGIHPRNLGWLSDVEPLARLLNLFTEVAVFPSDEQEMPTAQCVAPAGGPRPIGQCKSLHRARGRRHEDKLQC